MKRFFKSDLFIGLVLALVALCVYLKTLAPSISWMDSGELATDVATLGIAHPTGYPLFTFLGWAFVHLPLGARVIWKLNLFTALLCSAAIFIFYRLFLFFISEGMLKALGSSQTLQSSTKAERRRRSKEDRERSAKEESGKSPKTLSGRSLSTEALNRIAAATTALILAFSATYWSQALSIEVYPLHLLFLSLVIFLFARAILGHIRNPSGPPGGGWYVFAFVLGLSFTNHMTTILLAPAFLYLYFATHGFRRNAWIKLGKAAFPFCAALLLYLYLPLRAVHRPIMDWGDPDTFAKFWSHVTGAQFHALMFSSSDVMSKQTGYFFSQYLPGFGYAPLLFALIGLGYLFTQSRKMLLFSVFLFLSCLFYATNYDIPDIDSYFLLAYVATAIWIVYGLRLALKIIHGRFGGKAGWGVGGALCIVLILLPLGLNYRGVDESRDYSVEDYTRNVLGSLDSGAVILSSDFQYFTSAACYLQFVEGFRPDIAVIDLRLLALPWYYAQLERRYPWLIQNAQPESGIFLRENEESDFDGSGPNKSISQEQYLDGIRSLIAGNYRTHPLYVGINFNPQYLTGYQVASSGLVFRVYQGTPPVLSAMKDFSFRSFPRENPQIADIRKSYAVGYVNQGVYRSMQGDKAGAAAYLRKALAIQPDYTQAQSMLNQLGFSR